MCGASLFFTPFAGPTKRMNYLCSFIEAIPRLVIRHLMQPVFRFLGRLAVVVFVVPLLPAQNSLQNR
jgi:hypothetical protein